MIRMGTGERAGSKNSKGHVSKRNVKSDDSDEDYRLEEDELYDQTDELESLAGDASDEESLGSFGDEDQDEIVRKVVRSTPRKRSAVQTKKDINKGLKRRKRISYGEEEKDVTDDDKEEEDDYDNDCDSNYDHFLDEEHELPYSMSKVRKIGNTDDDDYNPDNPDIFDEENLPSSKRRSKKKSDSDDDDFNLDDHDILDEEELLSPKRKKKKKGMDDDDFNPDDQDFFDEDELPSPKGKNKKKCDTDDDEFIPEDVDLLEEEELPSPKVKNKKKHDTDDDEFNSDDLDLLDEEEGLPSSKGKYKNKGDTDDDDEFYPDDFDLLDEEEEFPCLKEKNKKRGQYSLKRKRSVRGQKIKPQKKKSKGSRKSTKSTSVKSRKFKNKVPSSRGICKRVPKRKKKNATLSSDSDFVSFESTDHEFTISEEEREQVREAKELFQRETSNLRCVKRDQEDVAYKQPRNLTRRKGKEKVQEVKIEAAKQVCGICLTKEGKNTVRGTLNCCNHFFCCACIIEWSKVESRCPLCKQRFITISKSAKCATRIDLRDAVIPIPERDQVYQPSEEELRGYLDPYENVYCTECHEGGDDALMLLCDLCDSPAHTYCVGLGREVPDGNWYCEGCRPSALGFTTSHAQDHTLPSQRLDNPAINEPLAFENMAEIDLNITIPETPVTPRNGFLVSPRQPSSGTLQAQPPLSGVGVSTLSGRRRVHRLQYLLSNNRSGMRVDPATSERRINILGPWGDRSAQPPFLETTSTTDVGALYHAGYLDRLQENSFRTPTTNREDFPGRQNLARGQAPQVPSVGDSTPYGFMQFGQVGGTNLGLNSVPGCEWLQPCTSRLNLGPGTSLSPIYNGDMDQNSAKQLQ